MGKLILVRHGQTEANVERRLDTRLPGARLTEFGESQAQAFGLSVAGRVPRALVASPALRARQTAQFVERESGIATQVREGIHEAQAGELEDRSDRESHELFMKVYHSWHAGDLGVRVPGGESGYDILERYVPVLSSLREEFLEDSVDDAAEPGSGDVLVVSHGAAIRLVAAHLAGINGVFSANTHLDNTQTVELVPTADGGWRCVRWGLLVPPFEPFASAGPDDPMG
ncbi:histidine phosphatase family protein [Rhodococcus oryzae]|uniref:Histidine phosphatase family protein n=1 Tax=Rhodococcus oryzae TaxID=2571143 RepID=A0ABY2RD18_9NOCA|nr:histidine phosphatase family protein [Rhodococcus oryzae]TJZ73254.1 histidine phosphatase family protein [Rhodococcus oryzae]